MPQRSPKVFFPLLWISLILLPILAASLPATTKLLEPRRQEKVPLLSQTIFEVLPKEFDDLYINEALVLSQVTFCRKPTWDAVKAWKCGACSKVPQFEVHKMDGNGVTDQTYIVGYWEKTGSVMVAYQGTNVQDLWKSARGPLDIRQVQLDSSLFPHPIGRDETFTENRQKALVHSGAQSHFQVHAKEIMELVSNLIKEKGAKNVITTGHSFGGALAILAALSLKLNLGSDIKISSRVFASPKIGNQALADYIDNAGLDIVRVNYGKDVIPLLPTGKYRQVSREIRIVKDESSKRSTAGSQNQYRAYRCDGQENTSKLCQAGAVGQNLIKIFLNAHHLFDHFGPYNFAGDDMWINGGHCKADGGEEAPIQAKLG